MAALDVKLGELAEDYFERGGWELRPCPQCGKGVPVPSDQPETLVTVCSGACEVLYCEAVRGSDG